MSIRSIRDDLLILNSAEEEVLKIQELIDQTAKQQSESQSIDIDEVKDRFIERLALLPIIENYTPDHSSFRATSHDSTTSPQLIQELDTFQNVLEEYSSMIHKKRAEIAPPLLLDVFEEIEDLLARLKDTHLRKGLAGRQKIEDSSLPKLKEKVQDIEICLGENISLPERWADLKRHLAFGEIHDLEDIVGRDWPSVRRGILKKFFRREDIFLLEDESISEFRKLANHIASRNQFSWKDLSPKEFERLIFQMVSSPDITYENAEFLMQTNAPDGGRDISVYRVYQDSLFGPVRHRAIIQCKHWLDKSLSVKDVSYLKDQLTLWEPPRVDILIIATTGYFSESAVRFMENHNQSSSSLRIEYWSIEKIKTIIDSRPYLLEKFRV